MTLPVNNYNDIINILNASVEKYITDSPPTSPNFASGRGCDSCDTRNPPLPTGPIVFSRNGCIGRPRIKNLPTITIEEIGDIEFRWNYPASNFIGECTQGHACGFANFKLYINDTFVSNFDFNNISFGEAKGGRFKLKDLPNASQLINNIIKNRSARTCECVASTTSEECREWGLQVKITADTTLQSGNPSHVVGEIELTVKNKSWMRCFSDVWGEGYVGADQALIISNPFGKGYCVCLPRKRWYPPDTDTATVAL